MQEFTHLQGLNMQKSIKLFLFLLLAIVPGKCGHAYAGGYTLYSVSNGRTTYLLDAYGNVAHSWSHVRGGGYSVYLLENSNILRTAEVTNSVFNGGGSQGCVQEIDWNGNVVWEYICSSSTYFSHHDICPMPNNNVLIIAWELKTASQAQAAGRKSAATMWPDKIIEVNRTTSQIVWEWHAWDHLIQNYDANKPNYGVIAQHPELLNINLGGTSGGGPGGGPGGQPGGGGGDWLHMNGLSYNASLDEIAVTSHMMSEVYIIDHSTTTAEAASHSGGRCGRGGDFLYRWGNPANYGAPGTAVLSVCHCPAWVPAGFANANNLLIFNNGTNVRNTSIVEITPPLQADGTYAWTPGTAYAPASATWSYATNFYAQDTGSCQRLADGNTVITNPGGNIFEVNSAKQTVWSHTVNGQITRSQRYMTDYAGLSKITGAKVSDFHDASPADYDLAQNFPNPFNPETSIRFRLPGPTTVHVAVYSLTGELVATLINGQKYSAGVNSATFDAGKLPAGVYFYRIATPNFTQTKKMTLLR
jgi:hypothetical protein